MLRQHGWRVAYPERTFATVDHIVPTSSQRRPFLDVTAEEMTTVLERNCREFGIQLWTPGSPGDENQGIVHVIGPELGLTQPGMTIACGDSHTSTHGALGAIAFGIGTSQVRDVLASQCLALDPLKVRRIDVNGRLGAGRLREGRHPDDHPPPRRPGRRRLRVRIRRHHARRDDDRRADDDLQHVDRRRRARRLRQPGRDDVRVPARAAGSRPPGAAFDRAVAWWRQIASDPDASLRRPRDARRRGDRADRHLGHQPRSVGGRSASRLPRAPTRKRSRSWGSSAARASQGTRSTSPSSDRAPTAGCPISRRPRALVRGRHVAPHVQGARRARLAGGRAGRPKRKGLHEIFIEGRVRMARRRLLDVPRR